MRGVLPDPDIDSVCAWDLNATQDPGVGWWIERMKEAARLTKHWDKNPSAERAELAKRKADGDLLEAVLDGMQAKANDEQKAASVANDVPPPVANDAAKKPRTKKK